MMNERLFDKFTSLQRSVRLCLSLHVEFVELMIFSAMMMPSNFIYIILIDMKKLVTLLKHNSEFFVIAIQIAPYIIRRKKIEVL